MACPKHLEGTPQLLSLRIQTEIGRILLKISNRSCKDPIELSQDRQESLDDCQESWRTFQNPNRSFLDPCKNPIETLKNPYECSRILTDPARIQLNYHGIAKNHSIIVKYPQEPSETPIDLSKIPWRYQRILTNLPESQQILTGTHWTIPGSPRITWWLSRSLKNLCQIQTDPARIPLRYRRILSDPAGIWIQVPKNPSGIG